MMLVPPSQTIAASLQQLASSTALHLEAVWDEVGYSPDERAAQLSDLLAKFRQVCDDKVAEERGVAQTFRKEIDAAREEIVHLSRALRVDQHTFSLQTHLHSMEYDVFLLRKGLSASACMKRDSPSRRGVVYSA